MADDKAVVRADAVLRAGGVVLYPTDTLYGLGCDALSNDAVAKIYSIKGREIGKPIHAIVADMQMAGRYGEINDTARVLASRFLPGPLTLILNKKKGLETGIASKIDTIGIRVPDNKFCLALSRKFDGAITTTSANASGALSLRRIPEILVQLGKRVRDIDLIIDAGELPERLPSTVADVSTGMARILREGAISIEDIQACVGRDKMVI